MRKNILVIGNAHTALAMLASIALTANGCTADNGAEDGVEGLDPETTFYTRTVVTVSPDGSHEVTLLRVSLAEQLLARTARETGKVPRSVTLC